MREATRTATMSDSITDHPSSESSSNGETVRQDRPSSTDSTLGDDAFAFFDANMDVIYFEDIQDVSRTPTPPREPPGRKDSALKRRLDVKQQKLRALAAKKRAALERQIRKRREAIRKKMTAPGFVMTIDKVSFVMGILIIMAAEFVLLVVPEKLGLFYTALLFPLMVMRYYVYRKGKMHYFMYDFCYYAQVMLLLQIHRFPDNERLFKINFALTNGPLAMATVMWRNSLVFHSVDKMTSSMLHILPPFVVFSIRWSKYLDERVFPMFEQFESTALEMIMDFGVYPLLCYSLWQIIYLVKTEIISRKKLEYDTENITSLRWLTRNKDSFSYKVINQFGENRHTEAFVFFQGIYVVLTLIPIPLYWASVRLHALYLGLIFLVALANGADYYFAVFASRYLEKLSKDKNGNK